MTARTVLAWLAVTTVVAAFAVLFARAKEDEARREAARAQRVAEASSRFQGMVVPELARLCAHWPEIDGDSLIALWDVCHQRRDELSVFSAQVRAEEFKACSVGLPEARCAELFDALDCVDDFDECADGRGYYMPAEE